MNSEKAIDFSDFDVLEEIGCLTSLPLKEEKEKAWAEFIDGHKLNVKKLEASAKCFYDLEHIDLCYEYATKFYNSVELVFEKHHRDYA